MPSTLLDRTGWHFLPLAADDIGELGRALDDLERQLLQAPRDLMLACAASFDRRREAPYAAVIAGQSSEDLRREVAAMRPGIVQAERSGKDWETPRGSYFTPTPLGRLGSLVFVYPGAESPYLGMGQEILDLFPQVSNRLREIDPEILDLLMKFREESEEAARATPEERRHLEQFFWNHPFACLEAGVAFSLQTTIVLRENFGVQPAMACGYSLGELSMLWALGAVADARGARQALRRSEVFTERLGGPKQAAREYLGLPPNAYSGDDSWWSTFIVRAPVEDVRAALRGERAVFIACINTPSEVALRGVTTDCLRVIERLHCAASGQTGMVIHCEAMRSEYEDLLQLLTFPVLTVPQTTLYSVTAMRFMPVTSQGRARALATAICEPVDFPNLIERVYGDGGRLFVELGPQGACTAWIQENLAGRPHVAMTMNKRGVADHRSILRVLAKLCSHRVAFDLVPLFAH